jgi:translation elongation factor EF-G
VSHVVGAALTAPNSKRDGARKLIDALRVLTASDPSLGVRALRRGRADHHGQRRAAPRRVALAPLSTLAGFAVERSPPLVPLRETITAPRRASTSARAQNKHNRLLVTAEPLEPAWRAALLGAAPAPWATRRDSPLLRAAGVAACRPAPRAGRGRL